MDVAWLEDFIAVVKSGGFSRAANRRGVTQPALSRRVQALELWLGTTLFKRDTHTVTLTEAGASFLPAAEETVRRLLAAREEAFEIAQIGMETVRIAATHALSQTLFPEFVRGIEQRVAHHIPVQLMVANMTGCEQLMLDGQAQFMIAHQSGSVPTRLDPRRFRSATLETDMLIPVSAPRRNSDKIPLHPLPGKPQKPLPFLAYLPGSGVGRILTSALLSRDPPAWLNASFWAPVMLLTAKARDGLGIAWVPNRIASPDIKSGRLVRAGDVAWDIPIEVRIFRPRSRLTPAAENFWRHRPGTE